MRERWTGPLQLEQVRHPGVPFDLYHHQAAMLDEWDHEQCFLLLTKTGTGKTTAAMLPLMLRGLSAVAIYPTNELIRDQTGALLQLARRLNLRAEVYVPDLPKGDYVRADLLLVPIDSRRLGEWQRAFGVSTHSEALQRLLLPDKANLVLTNPDILFLIFALRYRAECLAALQGYRALVMDEFHLYTGVELAHALFLAYLGRRLGAFEKLVLLSATPDPDTLALIRKALNPRIVDASASSAWPVTGSRTAVHEVEVVGVAAGSDVVETAAAQAKALAQEIRQRRLASQDDSYVPAVVVLNSVVNAIHLEDRLVAEGCFLHEELAIIRGLSSRKIRDTVGKALVIGTSAVEVGIDFDCDWLIFEASEGSSFMQRFGRVGRHRPGIAVLLAPNNVLLGLDRWRGEVARSDFESRVLQWYADRPAYAWFVATQGGAVTTRAVVESVLTKVRQSKADATTVQQASEAFCGFWHDFCESVGVEPRLRKQVEAQFRNRHRNRWIGTYAALNTFRTSLPGEWVHDKAERARRHAEALAEYEADIQVLLRRAEDLRFDRGRLNRNPTPPRRGMLTLRGYGRWRFVRVELESAFELENGYLATTHREGRDLRFLQDFDGHRTSISHVMTLDDHVFGLFPKKLKPGLDWRIPVFPCGDRIITFDGGALLAREIWKRERAHAK